MTTEQQAAIERLSAENALLQLQIERIRQETIEECAKVADSHLARVGDHHPDKPNADRVAWGYGNASLNIAAAIRSLPAQREQPTGAAHGADELAKLLDKAQGVIERSEEIGEYAWYTAEELPAISNGAISAADAEFIAAATPELIIARHSAALPSAAPILECAKDNAVSQARSWAQEAKTQHSIVIALLNHFGLPEHDWEAERLIKDHVAALAAPAIPTWISVEERLPGEQGQDSEDVLVFLNGHCASTDMECRKGGAWGLRIGFYDAEKGRFRAGGLTSDVTHWMPLPAGPAAPIPADPKTKEEK